MPHSLGLSDTKNKKIANQKELDFGMQQDGTLPQSAEHIEQKPEKKGIKPISNHDAFALLENDLMSIMAFYAFLCRIGHMTAKLMEKESEGQ
jgi:hypothetical protein